LRSKNDLFKMSLTVYTGPMFSGKTTQLLREITRYADLSERRHALIINHSLDTRDIEKVVSSHASIYKGLSERIDVLSAATLDIADPTVAKYTIIGIDEANLYDDLVPMVKKWLAEGKHIICVGLDGDYRMERFGHINELLPLADTFVKLNAICSVCLAEMSKRGELITPNNTTPAPFTKKVAVSVPKELKQISTSIPKEQKQVSPIDIGGADKYMAVCRKHFK
jgi:thymidine kinase